MAGGQRLCPFLERNVFVPGLAGLFFFAFGEEIRWGQRIIGWEAPEALRTANRRQPLTIWRSFMGGESLLHRSRWFELFWPGYCVVLPLPYGGNIAVRRLCAHGLAGAFDLRLRAGQDPDRLNSGSRRRAAGQAGAFPAPFLSCGDLSTGRGARGDRQPVRAGSSRPRP